LRKHDDGNCDGGTALGSITVTRCPLLAQNGRAGLIAYRLSVAFWLM
jgi:hypothetical protein